MAYDIIIHTMGTHVSFIFRVIPIVLSTLKPCIFHGFLGSLKVMAGLDPWLWMMEIPRLPNTET